MQRMGESAHPVAEKNQAVANHAGQVNEMKKTRRAYFRHAALRLSKNLQEVSEGPQPL